MKSKEYINGFRHGIAWARVYFVTLDRQLWLDSKKAIKSLKKGR